MSGFAAHIERPTEDIKIYGVEAPRRNIPLNASDAGPLGTGSERDRRERSNLIRIEAGDTRHGVTCALEIESAQAPPKMHKKSPASKGGASTAVHSAAPSTPRA